MKVDYEEAQRFVDLAHLEFHATHVIFWIIATCRAFFFSLNFVVRCIKKFKQRSGDAVLSIYGFLSIMCVCCGFL